MIKRTALVVLAVFALAACGGSTSQTSSPGTEPTTGNAAAPTETPRPKPSKSAVPKPSASARSTTGNTSSGGKGGGPQSGGGSGQASPAATTKAIQARTPGTYTYDTNGSSTYNGSFSDQLPKETTLTADQPSGVRQRSVRDMRDDSGNGTVTETYLEFRDDGVYLDRIHISTKNGPISDERDYAPSQPARVARTGGGPGDHTKFTMTGSNSKATVTIDVLRMERVVIGGQPVDTYVVRTVTEFSGDLQGKSTSDTWYTPDHLLPVKEHVVTDAKAGANSVHTEYTAQLRKLSPS